MTAKQIEQAQTVRLGDTQKRGLIHLGATRLPRFPEALDDEPLLGAEVVAPAVPHHHLEIRRMPGAIIPRRREEIALNHGHGRPRRAENPQFTEANRHLLDLVAETALTE